MSARKPRRRPKRTPRARRTVPRLSSEDIETAKLSLIGVLATCELVCSSASRSAVIVLTRGALNPLHETLRLLGEKDSDFTTSQPDQKTSNYRINVMKQTVKPKRRKRPTAKRVALDPLALFLPVQRVDVVGRPRDSAEPALLRSGALECFAVRARPGQRQAQAALTTEDGLG